MADISTFTDLSGNQYNLKDAYARAKYFALDGGTAIPSGEDLNDYKTPGNYTCANAAVAGGIANVPVVAAFRMVVMRVVGGTTSGRYYQLLFPNVANSSPRIFIRRYTGTWSTWQVISPTISDLDGVVGIDHGGTGETTAAAAALTLTDALGFSVNDVLGRDYFLCREVAQEGSTFTFGPPVHKSMSKLLDFVKSSNEYGVGDSYAPSGAYAVAGFCTSNTIGFSIVLPKSIGSQVSGVTVNTLKIRVCTSAGYLSGYGNAGTSVTGTGYTVTASKRADNVVHIGVNHSNFSSISGGQALTIYIASMALSFT